MDLPCCVIGCKVNMSREQMDCTCIVCAILFFVSNFLNMALRIRDSRNMFFSEDEYRQLDPNFLEDMWEWRSDARALDLTAGLLNAVAWFTLCVPMVTVAFILSMNGTRLLGMHVLIMVLAVGGSVSELISRFMMVGMTGAAEWIYANFNLEHWETWESEDGIGYRVLEMIHLMTSGLILWIDAFEWLALSGILTLIFVSVRSLKGSDDGKFDSRWAALGLAIAILCIFDFLADILKFVDAPGWRGFSIFLSAMNMMMMFPMWLFMLGKQLPAARPKEYDSTEYGHTLRDFEVSKLNDAESAFVVDDGEIS